MIEINNNFCPYSNQWEIDWLNAKIIRGAKLNIEHEFLLLFHKQQ